MATIAQSVTIPERGVVKAKWETLTTTNADGAPFTTSRYSDKSVQVLGTFGAGGTLLIEGSNDGGTTWATLNDANGNALSFGAAKIEQILENVEKIRPRVSAGDGTTDLDVYIIAKG